MIDPEVLTRLLRADPARPARELAEALTQANQDRGQPGVVTSHAVTAYISRHKDGLRAAGVDMDRRTGRRKLVAKLTHNAGVTIAPEHQHVAEIAYLRVLDRLRAGDEIPPSMAARVNSALEFERRLLAEQKVVDLTEDGEPLVRPARPWELREDPDNRKAMILIDIITGPHAPPKGRRGLVTVE